MFDTFQNSVKVAFTLKPDGPLLLRRQNSGLDPAIADVEFMRTNRNGQSTVYLPGSSIKGVVRAHTERLIRSQGLYSCDPTSKASSKARDKDIRKKELEEQNKRHCNYKKDYYRKSKPDVYPHGHQCPTCFTWGSLNLAGRFRFGDAYPPKHLHEAANRTEVRTGVGISRKFQASADSALYDTEVVVGGGFDVKLTGENFDLWQVGLLGQALRDLDDGFVQVGGCKSRGMGSVRLTDMSVTFRFLGGEERQLCCAKSSKYNLGGDPLSIPEMEGVKTSKWGLFREVSFVDKAVDWLFDALNDGSLRDYTQAHRRRV